MTTTGRLNPDRLDLARRRRGMTKRGLAEAAAISVRSLATDYMDEWAPSDQTVARFSEILDFPETFFYGDTLEEPSLEGASFRALSKVSARLRNQALASGALGLSLSDWIDHRFTLPDCDIPTYDNADPELATVELRGQWGLGERPIPNMVHLLELHGVRVFALAEDTTMIDAYSFWRGDVPYVFLNTMKSTERSRMDAAHELGHLILHGKCGKTTREAEKEAQEFGASLLMPRGSVLSHVRPGASLRQTVADKRYWTVSVTNLTYRMHQLGLLSDVEYRQRFRGIGRRNYRTVEPQPAPRETSQVLNKVLRMLREDGIGPSHVAEYLSIYSHELSSIVFDLVTTPMMAPLPSRKSGLTSPGPVDRPTDSHGTLSVLEGGQR